MNLQPKMSVFGYPAKLQIRERIKEAQKVKKSKSTLCFLTNLQEKASWTHLRKLPGHISESLLHSKQKAYCIFGYIYILGIRNRRDLTHTHYLYTFTLLVLPSLELPRKKKKLQSSSKPRVFSSSKSSP